MNTPMLPPQVKIALDRLTQAGFQAYVVGGAVRDWVRGAAAGQDWDMTTDALPHQVEQVFRDCRLVETGLKHGTVTVLLDGLPLEITTFRVDGAYTDHRRPDRVRFTPSLEEDLVRRDFTMNALAWSPRTGLVDCCGGVADIHAGIIRCVGQPDRRFQEDGLRILRALRFASTLGFSLEQDTAAAVHRNRDLLASIAAERVQAELTRLLCGQNVQAVLLEYGDVLAVPIPELAPMFGFLQHNPHHDRDVWTHTAAVAAAAPAEPVLRWAALLHDVGKPDCFSLAPDGTGHFYGHAQRSTQLAEAVLARLRLDRDSRERILTLIRYHDLPIPPEVKPVKRLMNKLGADTVEQLIWLHKADTAGQSPLCAGRIREYDQVEAVRREVLAQAACFSLKDLAVNGRDMLTLGLRGPRIGQALEHCLNGVMDERLPNEKQALLNEVRRLALSPPEGR